jgi:hypothetical protein
MERPDAQPHMQRYPGPIVLLTCRGRAGDFRAALADELTAMGNDVYYMFLKSRPQVTAPGETRPKEMSFSAFVAFMVRLCRSSKHVLVFNSTNLVFPFITTGLRILCGGFWCFDMHDDLLYNQQGWRRLRLRLGQWTVCKFSNTVVHGAPTLTELFPQSHHLGNASALRRIHREAPDFSRILIMASLDERFDFPLTEEVAGRLPAKSFELFGRVSRDDPAVAKKLEGLLAARPNIKYFGPYSDADLPAIMARTPVMLAPYKMGSKLTRYIDPLRYYHCLNSGMEVVSTDIPQAHMLAEHLHIACSADEICAVLESLGSDPGQRRNFNATAAVHSWRKRAERLLDIVSEVSTPRRVTS